MGNFFARKSRKSSTYKVESKTSKSKRNSLFRTLSRKKTHEEPSNPHRVSMMDNKIEEIEMEQKKLKSQLISCRDQMATMREGSARNSVRRRAKRILSQQRRLTSEKENLGRESFQLAIKHAQQIARDIAPLVNSLKTQQDLSEIDDQELEAELQAL